MRTLADVLKLDEDLLRQVETDGVDETVDPQEFCRRILESRDFRQYLQRGVALGNLPPGIVMRLMDHGWGKPPERFEVSNTVEVESLTPDLVIAKLERTQHMLQLLRRAQRDDDDETIPSIH